MAPQRYGQAETARPRSLVSIITITIYHRRSRVDARAEAGRTRAEVAREVSRHARNRRPADARIVSDRSRFSSKTRNDRDPRSAAFWYIGSEAVLGDGYGARRAVSRHAWSLLIVMKRAERGAYLRGHLKSGDFYLRPAPPPPRHRHRPCFPLFY